MKVSEKLDRLYSGYYDSEVATKRSIAAKQTVSHILEMLPKRTYDSLIDVGAGEGAVLAELEKVGMARELHALEISESGIRAINARALKSLKSVHQFDGYSMPAGTEPFDLAIASHVLEHVEHERMFVQAIVQLAELVYIEVPLELTARIERSIRMSGPFGHINFYTRETFKNLLETSGVEVLAARVFPNSLAYERFTSGFMGGSLKYAMRTTLLHLLPTAATHRMTYLAGALCRKRSSQGSPS